MWCNGYDSIFWIENFEFKFFFLQSSSSSDVFFGRFDEFIWGRKVVQAKLPKEREIGLNFPWEFKYTSLGTSSC
jgi:hypothetical protein